MPQYFARNCVFSRVLYDTLRLTLRIVLDLHHARREALLEFLLVLLRDGRSKANVGEETVGGGSHGRPLGVVCADALTGKTVVVDHLDLMSLGPLCREAGGTTLTCPGRSLLMRMSSTTGLGSLPSNICACPPDGCHSSMPE